MTGTQPPVAGFEDEGSAISQGMWVAICNLPETFLHNKCMYSFPPFILHK